MNISIKSAQVADGAPSVVGIHMPRDMIKDYNEICLKNQKELVAVFGAIVGDYNAAVELQNDTGRKWHDMGIIDNIKRRHAWRRAVALKKDVDAVGEALEILRDDLIFDDFEIVDRLLSIEVESDPKSLTDTGYVRFQITQRTFVQFLYFQRQEGWLEKLKNARKLVDLINQQAKTFNTEMSK